MEEKKSVGPEDARKRVVLFVGPFIVLPAVTLVLWSFGLIKRGYQDSGGKSEAGINRTLPTARNRKDSSWNKLRFYEQADRDSARLRAYARRDPYSKETFPAHEKFGLDSNRRFSNGVKFAGKVPGLGGLGGYHQSTMEENELKVRKKLSELESDMNQAESRASSVQNNGAVGGGGVRERQPSLSDRMSALNELNGRDTDETEDPQLKRLDGMLEKVLDIRYPDRMKRRNDSLAAFGNTMSARGAVPISLVGPNSQLDISSGGRRDSGQNSGFFGLDDVETPPAAASVVRAVIPGRPTLVAGARVRLRLVDSIRAGGHLFVSGTYVWGVAAFAAQRMLIHISSLEDKGIVIPVALSVYDLDGMAGVNAPGTAERDVAKQSTDQALQSLSIASMDESVAAQTATASIQAAKTLIGRKIKLVKIAIPENYEVILKDDNVKVNH